MIEAVLQVLGVVFILCAAWLLFWDILGRLGLDAGGKAGKWPWKRKGKK